MGRAAAVFSNSLSAAGHYVSGGYHLFTGDLKQAGKDYKNTFQDLKGTVAPRTPDELAPDVQAPVVDVAPVVVDDAALALRRQRLLASSYGRSQTILDGPAASSSLGSAAGSTQLGG